LHDILVKGLERAIILQIILLCYLIIMAVAEKRSVTILKTSPSKFLKCQGSLL